MAEDVIVYCVVTSSQQSSAYTIMSNAGVNMNNVLFINCLSDSYWIRDYGPWFIFNGSNESGIVDFIYNRPRPHDDAVPGYVGSYLGIDVYGMDIWHTGGNYMTDGQGISISTDLVYQENQEHMGLNASEVDSIIHEYLGINTYHVVPDALGEYIKHIDCWAKYLAPDVIMIIEVSPSHSHYAQIEAAVDYFESQPSCYGTPYQVERVYTHLYEPYINSLILNNKVLVPITGSGWDDDAITAYESAMPGHEVLGFTGSWYNTDALHCRTMGVTDRGMLYIKHTPVEDTVYTANDYFVQANIIPYSGESVIEDSTLVYWKTSDDDEFNAIQMQHAGNRYFAFIPAQPDGTTIQYYIHSADSSGRSENHPYIGAPDAHSFYVQSGVSTDTQIASQKNIILYQNYPNPFSTSTTISFFNTKPSKNTKIKIYNIKGQLVNEFKIQSPIYSGIKLKINEIIWDGKDEEGKLQTNGIYFYSLKINNKIIQTKKMLLMR
ncbi:MAG: agmatine deiminase family protein, partial [Candidatus Cloacimonetes bacterium]|nr:agmatine deiminase family protein [Candidatus Cloacimonadota bacterium]